MTERIRGAGGTSGGIGLFLIGLAMAVTGAYLITTQVTVTSGYWQWGGYNTFGLTLIPLIAGIGLLFFNGRSIAGWILAGIIANLQIYFRPTTLFNTVMMLVLFAGGVGLVARSLKAR
jgi:hypothetical protein